MGLDQYAYAVKQEYVIDDFSFKDKDEELENFMYWRKNRQLQGWMEELYNKKGGTEEFNCRAIRLVEKDLLKLKEDIELGRLPDAQGFFWGYYPYTEEDKETDLDFIAKALKKIKQGYAVYYDSWW